MNFSFNLHLFVGSRAQFVLGRFQLGSKFSRVILPMHDNCLFIAMFTIFSVLCYILIPVFLCTLQ